MPRRSPSRGVGVVRAFTLVEMLIVVAALGLAASVVVTTMGATERSKLHAASDLVASDLEQARALSITSPADLTVFRSAADATGYWLALASAPNTPIQRGAGGDYRIVFGQAPADSLAGVTIALTAGGATGPGGGMIAFDTFGRLTSAGNATLTLSNTSGSIAITIDNGTGDVLIAPPQPPQAVGEFAK